MQLQMEPISVCDARCTFCVYPQMAQTPSARVKRLMPLEDYKRIIDEVVTIPLIDQITLTGLGETLLDRHLDERIRYAREKLPNILIDIYTNGSQLTLERGLKLEEAGLSVIYVSLNAVNRDHRLSIMGLDDYDKVVANTHSLIDTLEAKKSNMKVIVKIVASKDLMEVEDLDDFIKEWGGPYNEGGHAFWHNLGNWTGKLFDLSIKPKRACARALNEIMVLSDLRVSACCFDGFGEKILGDLNKQTLREMYMSQDALGFRQLHYEGRRSEIPICANCTAI